MPKPLRTIAYTSNATRHLDEPELRALFTGAALYNDRVGVTGLLLFSAGVFLQTFEGLHDDVESVWQRIREDDWHHVEQVFVDAAIDRRVYPAWAMMADLSTPDPTILSFLRFRKESPEPTFTAAQVEALDRTIEFVVRATPAAQ